MRFSSAPAISSSVRFKNRVQGFSLVEIVFALGIFSFSIVGIVGLFPVALQSHMSAKIGTTQAQIEQRLAAEVLLTDFSNLSQLNGQTHYFDAEGVELASASQQAIFTSKTVVTSASIPTGSTLYSPASMKKVIFYAIHDPAHKGVTSADKPTGSILIANTAPAS